MTKAENDQVLKLYTYRRIGHTDTVARSLSALVRASMSKKSRTELLAHAEQFGVIDHPEFII